VPAATPPCSLSSRLSPPPTTQQRAQTRALRAAPDAAPGRHLPLPAGASATAGGADAFAARLLAASGLSRARPPLPPGASGEVSYRVQPYQILSWYPRVVLLPGFLSADRCDRIVAAARAKGLARSPVLAEPGKGYADDVGGPPGGGVGVRAAMRRVQGRVCWRPAAACPPADHHAALARPSHQAPPLPPPQQTRTSTGVFMAAAEDPGGDLQYLEDKIAAATLLPASHGEVGGCMGGWKRGGLLMWD
jgi:hypothetical protein